jgi:hypothetical protein
MVTTGNRERRLRAQLRNEGFSLVKSRRRIHYTDHDQGGYRIVDGATHESWRGVNYELTLDDVEKWVEGRRAWHVHAQGLS